MTALAAHLPTPPHAIAFAFILYALTIGYLAHQYRTAPWVDEDCQPIGDFPGEVEEWLRGGTV